MSDEEMLTIPEAAAYAGLAEDSVDDEGRSGGFSQAQEQHAVHAWMLLRLTCSLLPPPD
jgi:hypothetical protein